MCQLMSKQEPPVVRLRREPTDTKHNVVIYRIGIGVNITRRLLGGSARMHPHPRKIVPEALLHILP